MDRSRPVFRWVFPHLLIFSSIPVLFIFIGLLAGGVIARMPFSTANSSIFRLAVILIPPLLTGGLLGLATGTFQIHTFHKLAPQLVVNRWTCQSGIGMALAFLAAAWVYNASNLSNPLPLAAVFSGAVYGLAAGLPQARLLKKQDQYSWRWILTTAAAGGFSFVFAISPVWLAEGNFYFWLMFPLCIASGMLYGLVTGLWVFSFSQLRKLSTLVPGGVKEKTV
jgi:hypothetical protein